jgi:outer membrane protein assembly factor BamB
MILIQPFKRANDYDISFAGKNHASSSVSFILISATAYERGKAFITDKLIFATLVAFTLVQCAYAQPLPTREWTSPSASPRDGFGEDVAINGNRVLVGASQDDTGATDAGRAFLYDAVTGNLLQTFNNPSPAVGAGFGYSVSLDGDFVLIGTSRNGSQATIGKAYLYSASTGNLLRTFSAPNPTLNDYFGGSVTVDNGRVFIGCLFDNTLASRGGRVYEYSAATGNLIRPFNDPTPQANTAFGVRISVSGNKVVIGDGLDNTHGFAAGQAHIFDEATGSLLRTLNDPTPGSGGERFGVDLAISGNYIAVGAPHAGPNPLAYYGEVHLFDANTGQFVRTLSNPNPALYYQYGGQVALDGDHLFIGAVPDESFPGTAFLYSAATGTLLEQFGNPVTTPKNGFTNALAIDGSLIAITAPGDYFDSASVPGAVYLYSIPEPSALALATLVGLSGFVRAPRRRMMCRHGSEGNRQSAGVLVPRRPASLFSLRRRVC